MQRFQQQVLHFVLQAQAAAFFQFSAVLQVGGVPVDGIRHFSDPPAVGQAVLDGDGLQHRRQPEIGAFGNRLRAGLGMVGGAVDPAGRVAVFQHVAQRPLGVLHARPVGLVDHQDIGNLQNTGLDGLDVIAQAGGFNHHGGVGQPGDIHFTLAGAYRLNQNQVKAGGIHGPGSGGGGAGQPAQGAPRCHRADEDARVACQVAHAQPVAENGPTRERAGRVDRNDAHLAGRIAVRRNTRASWLTSEDLPVPGAPVMPTM